MKGYKAFNKDWRCRGFQYEIGQTYELPEGQKLEMCKCGFHFCKNPIDVFGYYPFADDTVIAEIEALGDIQQEGTKYVTSKIRIVKEFTREQLRALIRDDDLNTGDWNRGKCNSGNHNTGRYNSGDCNSGNYNGGNHNSGNYNGGNHNSGDCNSGDCNSGNHNRGGGNSGYANSGDYNSGNSNAGDYNSGNNNAGKFNSGCANSGFFNSNEPKMRIFNQESTMTMTEFLNSLDYSFASLCKRIFIKGLIKGDVAKIKALPNFNAEIFKEITDIDIEEIEEVE